MPPVPYCHDEVAMDSLIVDPKNVSVLEEDITSGKLLNIRDEDCNKQRGPETMKFINDTTCYCNHIVSYHI